MRTSMIEDKNIWAKKANIKPTIFKKVVLPTVATTAIVAGILAGAHSCQHLSPCECENKTEEPEQTVVEQVKQHVKTQKQVKQPKQQQEQKEEPVVINDIEVVIPQDTDPSQNDDNKEDDKKEDDKKEDEKPKTRSGGGGGRISTKSTYVKPEITIQSITDPVTLNLDGSTEVKLDDNDKKTEELKKDDGVKVETKTDVSAVNQEKNNPNNLPSEFEGTKMFQDAQNEANQ